MEIGPVVNTPTNSPINAAPTINPEFNEHSVEYIEHIHEPADVRQLGCIIMNEKCILLSKCKKMLEIDNDPQR